MQRTDPMASTRLLAPADASHAVISMTVKFGGRCVAQGQGSRIVRWYPSVMRSSPLRVLLSSWPPEPSLAPLVQAVFMRHFFLRRGGVPLGAAQLTFDFPQPQKVGGFGGSWVLAPRHAPCVCGQHVLFSTTAWGAPQKAECAGPPGRSRVGE